MTEKCELWGHIHKKLKQVWKQARNVTNARLHKADRDAAAGCWIWADAWWCSDLWNMNAMVDSIKKNCGLLWIMKSIKNIYHNEQLVVFMRWTHQSCSYIAELWGISLWNSTVCIYVHHGKCECFKMPTISRGTLYDGGLKMQQLRMLIERWCTAFHQSNWAASVHH